MRVSVIAIVVSLLQVCSLIGTPIRYHKTSYDVKRKFQNFDKFFHATFTRVRIVCLMPSLSEWALIVALIAEGA